MFAQALIVASYSVNGCRAGSVHYQQVIITHGFRLGAAYHPCVVGVAVGERQRAMQSRVKNEVYLMKTNRLAEAQFVPGASPPQFDQRRNAPSPRDDEGSVAASVKGEPSVHLSRRSPTPSTAPDSTGADGMEVGVRVCLPPLPPRLQRRVETLDDRIGAAHGADRTCASASGRTASAKGPACAPCARRPRRCGVQVPRPQRRGVQLGIGFSRRRRTSYMLLVFDVPLDNGKRCTSTDATK